jgi:hypothetical protein
VKIEEEEEVVEAAAADSRYGVELNADRANLF